MAKVLSTPDLLLGTRNRGKLTEITALLAALPFRLVSVSELPQLSTITADETGTTYAANALLKAQAYGQTANMLTLAEDSGLEVVALGGFPGIHSDRWLPGTFQEKNLALLAKLDALGQAVDRTACFINVTCLFDPATNDARYFEGQLQGTLAMQPTGDQGFGYDSVFIPEGYSQTLAELGSSVKNQISARAQSLIQVQKYLRSYSI